MKKSTLLALWGVLYILCAGLGFLEEPQGAVRAALFLASVAFFVPPAVLLYRGKKRGDLDSVKLVRRVSVLSLAATVVLLIASIVTAVGSDEMGSVMHILLGLVSVPMFCSNFWVVSLFLWAVLLLASAQKPKK